MTKSLTNTAGTLYFSNSNIDKVIFAKTVTVTVPSTTISFPVITGINQFARPIGIYSTDNGVTWNDCGGQSVQSGGSSTHITLAPSITCNLNVSPNGNVTVYPNSSTVSGYTIIVKFVLLAEDNPSSLPAPINVSTTNKYSYTSNLGGTYRQINQVYSADAPTSGSYVTVPLTTPGKIPIVNYWVYSKVNDWYYILGTYVTSDWQTFTQPFVLACVVAFTTTSVLYQLSSAFGATNTTSKILMRIYKQ